MGLLRHIIAVVFFILGAVLVIELTTEGFKLGVFIFAVVLFLAAYIVWPSKTKGQRDQSGTFLDIVEFIIEAPVDIVHWALKVLGRLFGGSGRSGGSGGDGIDFDV